MISVYFKVAERVIKAEIDKRSIGMAQVEAQLLAVEENITPTSPLLAVVPKSSAVTA